MVETTKTPDSNGNGKPIAENAEQGFPVFGSSRNYSRSEMLAQNATTISRWTNIFQKLIDPRRDLNAECGYPEIINRENYRDLYDRFGPATRVVELLPKESWKQSPDIFEIEDDEVTEFETAWKDLDQSLRGDSTFQDEIGSPIFEYLKRIDILSGIGQFGVLLFGIDDGLPLDEPAKGINEDGSLPVEVEGCDKEEDDEEEKHDPKKLTKDREKPSLNKATKQPPFRPYKLTVNAEEVKNRGLMFLRAFDESLVDIVRYESNPTSPRFGQPTAYYITFNDPNITQMGGIGLPLATYEVHWTRVLHVADMDGHAGSSEIFANPRMKAVFNHLLDLRKVAGGSGEMYWRGALPGISFETHPQLGGDVDIDLNALKDESENFFNGLQRQLITSGMTAKTLAPQVVDPTPQINNFINLICIKMGIPVRIFMGSERGELASSQDDGTWNDRVRDRQNNYVTARLIVPFIDRLVMIGILPRPCGYSVQWPELDALSASEKADIALKKTQALVAYASGDVESIMPLDDFYERIMDFTDEEAEAIMENATDKMEGGERFTTDPAEAQQQQMDMQQQETDMKQEHLDKNGELPQEANPFGGGKPLFGKSKAGAGKSKNPFDRKAVGNYDPDQERADDGKWTSGGGSSTATETKPTGAITPGILGAGRVGVDGRRVYPGTLQEAPSREAVSKVAASYVEKYGESLGLKEYKQAEPVKLDTSRSREIGQTYENLPETTLDDPKTRAAYEKLSGEVLSQYKHMTDSGMKVEFTTTDAYKSAEDMMKDVAENSRLKVFLTTHETFGSTAVKHDHPLLNESGIKQGDHKLLYNDLFRAVHDYFGHASEGNQFGAIGEERAWVKHSRMFSPLARQAMTTETRGQNSWVNFGPHMWDKDGWRGDKQHPRVISPQNRPFATQKVGLLPTGYTEPTLNSLKAILDYRRWASNAFCPTGEGGGIDPSCSSSGDGRAGTHDVKLPKGKKRVTIDQVDEALKQMGYKNVERLQPEGPDWKSLIKVTHPSGKTATLDSKQVRDLVYEGHSDSSGHDTVFPRSIENAFCPTGEGGGIDPTCSPGGSSGEASGSSGPAADPKTPPPPGPAHYPHVEHDGNKDGVTDSARVGVPAMDVPPPPPIGRLPNLDPRERKVESAFIKAYESDPDGLASQYRNEAINAKPGEPPTFNTDDAKGLSSAWQNSNLDERSSNRATLNVALHQTANAIAKRAFIQHLDTLKTGDEVLVTVGGCGAGKGYALGKVPEAMEMKAASKAVWDSAGDQNATENPWIQKEVERRGLKANYVYVHADPYKQWADPERGVVKRAADPKDGRMVDASVFADSYAIGARNHQAFYEKNRENSSAKFTFLENKAKPTLLSEIPKEALKINRKELRDFAASTVDKADTTPAVKRGALIGKRIWSNQNA